MNLFAVWLCMNLVLNELVWNHRESIKCTRYSFVLMCTFLFTCCYYICNFYSMGGWFILNYLNNFYLKIIFFSFYNKFCYSLKRISFLFFTFLVTYCINFIVFSEYSFFLFFLVFIDEWRSCVYVLLWANIMMVHYFFFT